MESANGITRQQAEDEMQLFKKVFTVVRLLDGEHLEQMHKRCKLDCKDEKEKKIFPVQQFDIHLSYNVKNEDVQA